MTDFFESFGVITGYETEQGSYDAIDLTSTTGFDESVTNNELYFTYHQIVDGETPIILADRAYDNPDLFWIIMSFNNIYDEAEHWPLTENQLVNYVSRVYGAGNEYDFHHRETLTGDIVPADYDPEISVVVSNFEYEKRANDKKRKIKVPIPSAVSEIISSHKRLMTE